MLTAVKPITIWLNFMFLGIYSSLPPVMENSTGEKVVFRY